MPPRWATSARSGRAAVRGRNPGPVVGGRTPGAAYSMSLRSRRSGGSRRQSSAPARPGRRPSAASRQSLPACIPSSASRSVFMPNRIPQVGPLPWGWITMKKGWYPYSFSFDAMTSDACRKPITDRGPNEVGAIGFWGNGKHCHRYGGNAASNQSFSIGHRRSLDYPRSPIAAKPCRSV